ncbi:hypothetical protein IWQ60_001484 [Tieghemiomyces parasiticus]|uniref:HTH La-type RNA-binding domain-containing protein n=1 Tax=Tieghemiomyces parasiticus TaxID=78921 RepID=A0A9W8ADX4_9FUNG|nr:hypothetical protein IWQ60_001484 [Tieghemiomyces parasiticus]
MSSMDIVQAEPVKESPESEVQRIQPALLRRMEHYFTSEQINSTLIIVREALTKRRQGPDQPDTDAYYFSAESPLDQAWLPVIVLAGFQRIRQITTDLNVVLQALVASEFLELSANQLFVRRRPGTGEEKTLSYRERCTVSVRGFPERMDLSGLNAFYTGHSAAAELRSFLPPASHPGAHCNGVASLCPVAEETYVMQFRTPEAVDYVLEHCRSFRGQPLYYVRMAPSSQPPAPHPIPRPPKPARSRKNSVSNPLPNTVIRFDAVDPSATHQQIKEAFERHATVHSVDFRRDDTSGYVRLKRPGAQALVQQLGTLPPVRVAGAPVQLTALTGETERLYWRTVQEYHPSALTRHGSAGSATARPIHRSWPTLKAGGKRPARRAAEKDPVDDRLSRLLRKMQVEPTRKARMKRRPVPAAAILTATGEVGRLPVVPATRPLPQPDMDMT